MTTLKTLLNKAPLPDSLPTLPQVLILLTLRSHPEGLYGLEVVDRIADAIGAAKGVKRALPMGQYYDALRALNEAGLVESRQGVKIAANAHKWLFFATTKGESALVEVEKLWGSLDGLPL